MLDFINSYDDLTESERKALTYVMNHVDEVPYLTINQLAEQAFISKTVIINLAQKMGFSGFKELKYHINQQLKQDVVDHQQHQLSIKEATSQSVNRTMSLTSETDLLTCAETLLAANNIFIMARGTSKPVGYYLEHLLFSLGIHCFFIKDYNLSESFTNLVTEKDVVILISLSGSTKKIVDTARKVHLKKAKIISLTSFQSSILSSYADLKLFCHTEEQDTKTDDAISRIGFFLIVDLLVRQIKYLREISSIKTD